MRYELTDFEWTAIRSFLPNKPRGVPRVDDRRVLNGIFWVLRSGAPWRDLPVSYGPRTTCYNRFVRWRQAGVWDRIMDALAAAHDAAVQMIDTTKTAKQTTKHAVPDGRVGCCQRDLPQRRGLEGRLTLKSRRPESVYPISGADSELREVADYWAFAATT